MNQPSFPFINQSNHTSKEVEKYYEKWTDEYIEFGNVWQSLLTPNVEDMIGYIANVIGIKEGMKVLDAGCGVCGPAIILAEKYQIHIEALTHSEKQIQYSNKNIKNSQLKGTINLCKGDYHYLEEYYQPEEFDVVFFLESLHNSCQPEQVIQSVRKVLKPGGILYIKDPYRKSKTMTSQWMKDQIESVERQFLMRLRTVGEMIDILGECGFELIFCRQPEIEASCEVNRKFVASKHPNLYLKKPETIATQEDQQDFNQFLEIKVIKS
jgi:ubiquinone/menaquinone biosynthesis C-methylase UbiE